jgi:hypothetical protein
MTRGLLSGLVSGFRAGAASSLLFTELALLAATAESAIHAAP